MAEDSESTHPRHLTPSELGTKEYWESFYENSLAHISSKKAGRSQRKTHADDDAGNGNEDRSDDDDDDDEDDDPGTSWFTEHNAPEKVLQFLTSSSSFPFAPCNNDNNNNNNNSEPEPEPKPEPVSILDIGTGNGSMLSLLRDEGGYNPSCMVGIDYSLKSIELARQLQVGKEGEGGGIRFEVCDVFDGEWEEEEEKGAGGGKGLDWFPYEAGGFDVVLDKGTFDAISLAGGEEGEGEGGRICERYPGVVSRLVRRGGFFVITSCNWTEGELVEWFSRVGKGKREGEESSTSDGFVVWDKIEYPKFRFGGQEGQGVCTVCFRREGGETKVD